MLRIFQKGNTPIDRIQIFGQRCSGTNYLEALLKANIRPDILTWEFGWKHWFCTSNKKGEPAVLFIAIYRDPLTWIQSFHRQPWHAPKHLKKAGFGQFIRQEWYSVYDEDSHIKPGEALWHADIPGDLCPKTGRRFKNVLLMRNAKIQHFEELRERFDNVCYLNYEALQKNPQAVLNAIAEAYKLPLLPEFKPVNAYKGSGGKYKPRKYRGISFFDRRFILKTLDIQQEAAIGYDVNT